MAPPSCSINPNRSRIVTSSTILPSRSVKMCSHPTPEGEVPHRPSPDPDTFVGVSEYAILRREEAPDYSGDAPGALLGYG